MTDHDGSEPDKIFQPGKSCFGQLAGITMDPTNPVTSSTNSNPNDVGRLVAAYWNTHRRLIVVVIIFLPLVVVGLLLCSGAIGLRGHLRLTPPVGDAHAPAPLAWPFDLTGLTIDRQHIQVGGPTKDGIPSLTAPISVPIVNAELLSDQARVVGVTVHGQSRAYPLDVLNWHECINDMLGGVPIAIIYCPLCDSVSVVDRRLDDQILEFGISGLLYNSNVLLYDRQDHALWSQIGFTALSGPHAGRRLNHLTNWSLGRFNQWETAHPDSSVVSLKTGWTRPYQHTPYADYFKNDHTWFPLDAVDNRMPKKTPVIGVWTGQKARAYPVDIIDGELTDRIAGQPIVLRRDRNLGTVHIVKAPPSAAVMHSFWFAWYAFYPETEVYVRQ